jgi:hypothetical protein
MQLQGLVVRDRFELLLIKTLKLMQSCSQFVFEPT